MARGLINRRGLGTQPAPMTGGQRMGGGGRGGGGRGGGGGGGRNRIPNTGLYPGRQGQAAANQDPETFFRSAVQKLGGLDYSGTPLAEFSDDYVAKLMDEYNAAQAGNQRLSPVEWLRDTYGAEWGGKKGRNFDQGDLGLGGGALEQAYRNWYSNTSPIDFMVGQATAAGGLAPSGGNQEFQRYFQDTFAPGVMAAMAGARQANPQLSVADLIAGRDLADEARRRFMVRPNAARQIGPANLAGRWSWFD